MKQGVIIFYDSAPSAVYTDGAIDPDNGGNSKNVLLVLCIFYVYMSLYILHVARKNKKIESEREKVKKRSAAPTADLYFLRPHSG